MYRGCPQRRPSRASSCGSRQRSRHDASVTNQRLRRRILVQGHPMVRGVGGTPEMQFPRVQAGKATRPYRLKPWPSWSGFCCCLGVAQDHRPVSPRRDSRRGRSVGRCQADLQARFSWRCDVDFSVHHLLAETVTGGTSSKCLYQIQYACNSEICSPINAVF